LQRQLAAHNRQDKYNDIMDAERNDQRVFYKMIAKYISSAAANTMIQEMEFPDNYCRITVMSMIGNLLEKILVIPMKQSYDDKISGLQRDYVTMPPL
jgi:hypothetical protein